MGRRGSSGEKWVGVSGPGWSRGDERERGESLGVREGSSERHKEKEREEREVEEREV